MWRLFGLLIPRKLSSEGKEKLGLHLLLLNIHLLILAPCCWASSQLIHKMCSSESESESLGRLPFEWPLDCASGQLMSTCVPGRKRGDADLILGQLGPPTNLGGPPRRIHRSCLKKKKISDSRRIFLDLLIVSRRIEKKRLPTRSRFHEELDAASRQNNPKGEILWWSMWWFGKRWTKTDGSYSYFRLVVFWGEF